ncbi:zinc finger, CCHC-type containing protein [Tanacetum coccineum]
MDESIFVSSIIDKLPPSWKDFKHTLKHGKDDLSLVQLGSHLRIEESLKAQDSDKGKGKEVGGPSVNMTEEGKKKHNKQNKGKKRSNENNSGSSSNKKPKLEMWQDMLMQFAVVDRFLICYYNNGMFMLNLNKVPDDSDSVYMSSSSTVVNTLLWHACLCHVHYKRMLEMSKDDLIPAIDENSEKCTNRAVVRLPDPKHKTLGEKGIDCIFVRYAEHSKAYRFYVIEPNDFVSINSIIESRDVIFDENRFSSILRPKDIIPNVQESQMDDHNDMYQVKFLRLERKEAIDDEIGSIMENNTWVLSDLPPGCKPLSCKWIFQKKMKVDGTIDKFKARLVIQGFRQKEGIDYFNTYAPVARITTIRLLLALAAIHNLVIHQMDVKTAFLNSNLDKEVYMKQPEGFVMLGNEHKVNLWISSNTQELLALDLYAMPSTRHGYCIYVVGYDRVGFTSNPTRLHWEASSVVRMRLENHVEIHLLREMGGS